MKKYISFLLSILVLLCLASCFFNKRVVYLKTENETGLTKGSDVRIKGYKIGTIDDVVLTKDIQSLIKVSFDENIPFPADSKFTIGQTDLLGTKVIDIVPSRSKNYISYGDTLTVNFQEKSMISDSIANKIERIIDTFAVEVKKHQ